MSYFNPAFIKFFKELSKNNNKEWFDANRKTYEKEVKEPFTVFVQEMINRIQKHEPDVNIKPSDAIMRVNKDIRFSKDKTPYNTHVAANISKFGKKDKSYPGMYFQFSFDKVMIYGGAYMLEVPALQKLRTHIAGNLNDFSAAYKDKKFIEKFGSILGEQHKRLPDEFKSVAEKEPLIANKQFYFAAELKPNVLTNNKLPDMLMDHYLSAKKLNEFLIKGLK